MSPAARCISAVRQMPRKQGPAAIRESDTRSAPGGPMAAQSPSKRRPRRRNRSASDREGCGEQAILRLLRHVPLTVRQLFRDLLWGVPRRAILDEIAAVPVEAARDVWGQFEGRRSERPSWASSTLWACCPSHGSPPPILRMSTRAGRPRLSPGPILDRPCGPSDLGGLRWS